MRVLVTGHRGYIGSVLVGVLRNARFDVVGLDCNLYNACDFGRIHESVPDYTLDVRDIQFTDLLSMDAVVHLAGLPRWDGCTALADALEGIDAESTAHLVQQAKQAGVTRFIHVSSASIYENARGHSQGESEPTRIHDSWTAGLLAAEQSVLDSVERLERGFTPVVLRPADIFGVSPRLCLDSLVNDLVASAMVTGRATLSTDGREWNSHLHVEDFARSVCATLNAPDDRVAAQVFNVVSPEGPFRVVDIADAVNELVPDSTRKSGPFAFNQPSLKVDGTKFRHAFSQFQFRWTLKDGIRQLRNAMIASGLTPGEWRSDRFRRVARLRSLLERGLLHPSLHIAGDTAALTCSAGAAA